MKSVYATFRGKCCDTPFPVNKVNTTSPNLKTIVDDPPNYALDHISWIVAVGVTFIICEETILGITTLPSQLRKYMSNSLEAK